MMERMNQLPQNPAELLLALRSVEPTSPRLTWYGQDSERVEFSGRVLENWVAKTANYLVDELDAEPGTTVALDIPLHWRSLVWLLATWAVGATAVTKGGGVPAAGASDAGASDAGVPDIIATADPAAALEQLAGARPAPLVVAVALPALAMRWTGSLPPRTLDYSGDVRAHADVFYADHEPAPGAVAWRHQGQEGIQETSYAQLLAGPAGAPQRVLLEAGSGWPDVVATALQTWAAGGSVVLLADGVAPTEHLRSTEQVTAG